MIPDALAIPVLTAAGAQIAALCGLWSAQATEKVLKHISVVPGPDAILLGSVLAVGIYETAPGHGLASALAAIMLGAIGACDWHCRVIPDTLVAAVIALGLCFHPLTQEATTSQLAIAGMAALLVYRVFATYARHRRGAHAFGRGDVKLMAAIAANIGFMLQFVTIISACLCALLVHLLRRNHPNSAIPFGVHLVVGCIITLFLIGRCRIAQLTIF